MSVQERPRSRADRTVPDNVILYVNSYLTDFREIKRFRIQRGISLCEFRQKPFLTVVLPLQPPDEVRTPLIYAASCAECSDDGQPAEQKT